MFFGVMVFADMFVQVLYPEKFAGAADYLRLLALTFLFVPYLLISEVILAGGQSRRHMTMTLIWAGAVIFGTLGAYHLAGLKAAIVVASASQAATLPYIWKAAGEHMKLSPFTEARMLAVAAVAAPLLIVFA